MPARQIPLLFLEGVPEGRGSNMDIRIPCETYEMVLDCDTPQLSPNHQHAHWQRLGGYVAAEGRTGDDAVARTGTRCVQDARHLNNPTQAQQSGARCGVR